jgi:hypothetical protein
MVRDFPPLFRKDAEPGVQANTNCLKGNRRSLGFARDDNFIPVGACMTNLAD